MRREAAPRWRAVVGVDASVDPLVQRKKEPWGLNHCPQRSGAEGETDETSPLSYPLSYMNMLKPSISRSSWVMGIPAASMARGTRSKLFIITPPNWSLNQI